MDRDGHRRPACGRNGSRHGELKVEVLEVRFGQAQNHRRAPRLGGAQDGFEEIETDKIERPYRIALAEGVVQHVSRINQWPVVNPRNSRYIGSWRRPQPLGGAAGRIIGRPTLFHVPHVTTMVTICVPFQVYA